MSSIEDTVFTILPIFHLTDAAFTTLISAPSNLCILLHHPTLHSSFHHRRLIRGIQVETLKLLLRHKLNTLAPGVDTDRCKGTAIGFRCRGLGARYEELQNRSVGAYSVSTYSFSTHFIDALSTLLLVLRLSLRPLPLFRLQNSHTQIDKLPQPTPTSRY